MSQVTSIPIKKYIQNKSTETTPRHTHIRPVWVLGVSSDKRDRFLAHTRLIALQVTLDEEKISVELLMPDFKDADFD